MEKLELTPVELMSLLGWKKSKVYYWINSGKFETITKMGMLKVLISNEDVESLKKEKYLKQFENFKENPESFEDVSKNPNSNVTKNYENVSNFSHSEAYELFNKSLETIERIHQTALSNFGYTTKLLTDGQSSLENELYEVKTEKKTVEESLKQSEQKFSENLKKFEKTNKIKNIIIAILALLLLFLLIAFVFVSNNSQNSQPVQSDGLKSSIIEFIGQ